MIDPKTALIFAVLALVAGPAQAWDNRDGACEACAGPRDAWPARAIEPQPGPYAEPDREARQTYVERDRYEASSRTVTRISYSQGLLSWPGKNGGGDEADEPYRADARGGPDCPPVRPGERVISCRYVPYGRQRAEVETAPVSSVLFADGGVGPEYIPSGGGGGTTIIMGGAGAGSSSSASASASASASVNASIVIDEHQPYQPHPHPKGGGGSWGPGSMGGGSGGGSWGSGSMGGGSGGGWGQGSMQGGGSWSGGGMASNGGASWPSGGGAMGGWHSGGGGHGMSQGGHGGGHHGKR